MKRVMFIIFIISLVLPSILFAGWGTPDPQIVSTSSAFKTWTITGTADGSGAFTDYNSTTTDQSFMKGFWIYLAEITLGSTVPNNNFKILIWNDNNASLTNGALDDCDNTTHSKFYMLDLDTTHKYTPPIDGRIKIKTSENYIGSAIYTIKLYLFK